MRSCDSLQHHLVGAHAGLAHRHGVEVEPDAQGPLVAHLDGRAGEAGGAHVLDGDDGAGCHQLKARLHQALFGEGVADLHGGAFLGDGVVELGGGHGGAADPVAPGLGAEIDYRAADARGGGVEDRVRPRDPGGEGVDQAVAVVGRMEADLAADGGDPEGIGVAADPGHDAVHQRAGAGMAGRPEAERVHRRHGARAHGEDVAQDAAHAGGGALVGLDVGGVVVALHLEDHGQGVARLVRPDIDHAGILAGAADDLRAGDGQGAQPFLRGFVGAVLVPHGRHDAELGEAERTAGQRLGAGVFLRRQPVGGDELWREGGVWHGALRWRNASTQGSGGVKAAARRARPRRGAERRRTAPTGQAGGTKKGRADARPKSNREVETSRGRPLHTS